MKLDCEKEYAIKNINTFNKLMINAIKAKENEFEFKGNHYTVWSDGICVQTLINERFLYRIFIKEYKNSSFTKHKLVNCIKRNLLLK